VARVDPTRNVRHAIRQLLPARPEQEVSHRLIRYARNLFLSLLLVVMVNALLMAFHVPKGVMVIGPILWLTYLALSLPLVVVMLRRDGEAMRQAIGDWEADPRRQAVERLGLDLAAGRLPEGMPPPELMALEAVAADWRLVREALETMSWARGDLVLVRDRLRVQVDEAMVNLLAEAGSGSPLGPSPFLLERARELFSEIAGEAAILSRLQARRFDLPTDASLEALRASLSRLKEARLAQQELTDHPTLVAHDE
jgi:hypothetical protein